MAENILITIVARGGSKGCPGKHTRMMAGCSLIGWTMQQAKDFGDTIFEKSRIVVSTDSYGIANEARKHDLYVLAQRPQPTDKTAKVPAIRNALIDVEAGKGGFWLNIDVVIDLDATAPLRTLDDIWGALKLFRESDCDCVLSCTRGVGRNPYFNLLEFEDDNVYSTCGLHMGKKDTGLITSSAKDEEHGPFKTRQQAPAVYEANSSIYVYKLDFLLREDVTSPLDGRCLPYVMPEESFYHVDSELDFEIVEFLMKRRLGRA